MISAANSRWRRCQRILRKGSPVHLHPLPARATQEQREGVTQVSAREAQIGLSANRNASRYLLSPPADSTSLRLIDPLLRIGADRWTVLIAADGASISPPMHN
jgi:hypothetical protein